MRLGAAGLPGLAGWMLLALALATDASAHTRSQSLSDWRAGEQPGELNGRFSIDAYRATLLYADARSGAETLPDILARHLATQVQATQAGDACALQSSRPVAAPAGFLAVDLRLLCPLPLDLESVQLQINALFRYAATHVHILRYQAPDGRILEQVLSPERHQVVLQAGANRERLLALVPVGAEHVWFGPDHLAFLLALLLGVRSVRALILTVTAFTVGHSLTLLAATGGWIAPKTGAVEMLIGYSILFASLEAARRHGWRPSRRGVLALSVLMALTLVLAGAGPIVTLACALTSLALALPQWPTALLALAFGLIHGAGFAGAYADLLSSAELHWAPLLGFNLGVELGQLLVLALIGAVILPARRWISGDGRQQVIHASLAGLLGLGLFWTLSRAV